MPASRKATVGCVHEGRHQAGGQNRQRRRAVGEHTEWKPPEEEERRSPKTQPSCGEKVVISVFMDPKKANH